ncbi:KTSC domain-containing protein [Mesorhizobium tianshanense]|uniref:KTSC domain-containing protein n=1 Tax=Mesorhizobium tianshanense TaxID=39844 RepID=UPI0030B8DE5A
MASTLIGEGGRRRQGLGGAKPAGSALPFPARDGTECWEMPSTAIQSMNYGQATRTLSVWFVPSGHRYDYDAVPPQT